MRYGVKAQLPHTFVKYMSIDLISRNLPDIRSIQPIHIQHAALRLLPILTLLLLKEVLKKHYFFGKIYPLFLR